MILCAILMCGVIKIWLLSTKGLWTQDWWNRLDFLLWCTYARRPFTKRRRCKGNKRLFQFSLLASHNQTLLPPWVLMHQMDSRTELPRAHFQILTEYTMDAFFTKFVRTWERRFQIWPRWVLGGLQEKMVYLQRWQLQTEVVRVSSCSKFP